MLSMNASIKTDVIYVPSSIDQGKSPSVEQCSITSKTDFPMLIQNISF